MVSWFDTYAKKSAQRATAEADQKRTLSRRRVIVGGSAAVATAWTAPMLMASPAYAYGVSTCNTSAGFTVCGNSNELQACCSTTQVCNSVTNSNGTVTNTCVSPGDPGGTCINNGSGTSGCKAGVYCNGNTSSNDCTCTKNNICGSYGATCSATAGCAPGYGCADGFCHPRCGTGNPCPTNLVTSGTLTCSSDGFCRQSCTNKQGCPNGRTCTNNVCV